MADRTYRRGRERERYDRNRGRQAEQFDAGQSWRDDERGYGQMGDGWREEDYGQFDSAGQSYSRERDWGRDPSYARQGDFRGGSSGRGYGGSRFDTREDRGSASFTGNDFGGRDFNAPRFTGQSHPGGYGAGTRLASNHGEWRDYGATPSRENRDYRGTWGRERDPEERGFLERAGDTIAHWLGDDADYRRGERGYRGHGPSGYSRSDDRIMEDACDCLTEDWGVDARQISVKVDNGEVTLEGTVPSREQKRRAEDAIENVSGVKHVQNNLRVQDRSSDFRSDQSDTTRTQA